MSTQTDDRVAQLEERVAELRDACKLLLEVLRPADRQGQRCRDPHCVICEAVRLVTEAIQKAEACR